MTENSPKSFSSGNFRENKAIDERDPQAHGKCRTYIITPGAVACATCPAVLSGLALAEKSGTCQEHLHTCEVFVVCSSILAWESRSQGYAHELIEQHGHACSFFANQSDALCFILNEGIRAFFGRSF